MLDEDHVVLRILLGLHRVDQFGLVFELDLQCVQVVHTTQVDDLYDWLEHRGYRTVREPGLAVRSIVCGESFGWPALDSLRVMCGQASR